MTGRMSGCHSETAVPPCHSDGSALRIFSQYIVAVIYIFTIICYDVNVIFYKSIKEENTYVSPIS